MQYQYFINQNGERIWLPLLAGAAIISAPFWLNKNCCNNYQQYPNYYPYPYPVPYYQYPNYPYYYNTTINSYR